MGQLDRVWFRDEQITRRQRAAFRTIEDALAKEGIHDEFVNYQGSWQSSISASGSTHSGAGCADLWLPGMGDNERTRKITRIIRNVGGQGGMLRGPGKFGGYVWHWHTFDLETAGMAASTQWQVGEYRDGREAISSSQDGPDPVHYRPDPLRQFNWDKYVEQLNAAGRVHDLTDRIEDKVDSLQSLRDERDRLLRKRETLAEQKHIDRVEDRIDNREDTIDDLRAQRDDLRQQIRRYLNH